MSSVSESWTAEDDENLVFAVRKVGQFDWRKVSSYFGGTKTRSACKARWSDYLLPLLTNNDGWTKCEDKKLMSLGERLCPQWSTIATQFTHKTARACEIRYNKIKALYSSKDLVVPTVERRENEAVAVDQKASVGNTKRLLKSRERREDKAVALERKASIGNKKNLLKAREDQPVHGDDPKRLLIARLMMIGRKERTVLGDGNCMYRALSHCLHDTEGYYKYVRDCVVAQLKEKRRIYSPFVLGDYGDFLTRTARDKEWGNALTLQAAADKFQMKILVVHNAGVTGFTPRSMEFWGRMYITFFENHFNSTEELEPNVSNSPIE